MSLSNTVENETLQDFLVRHPNLWLAWSTTDPGEDGSGITEPAGADYARQPVGDVTIAGNQLKNDDPIVFTKSLTNWGTLAYAAVFDAEDGVFCGSTAITPTACPINTTIIVVSNTVILSMD